MAHCVIPQRPTYKQHPTHRVYYTQTCCTHLLMYTKYTFSIKYESPSPKNTLRKHYGIYLYDADYFPVFPLVRFHGGGGG